jgi:FAD-linked oxidoreductase
MQNAKMTQSTGLDAPSDKWQNWSGSLPASSAPISVPQDMAALQRLVADTKGAVRPVGSGHSWTPLVPSDGAIIRLDAFGGVVSVDKKNKQARLGAGGKLKDLSPELAKQGLAFRNLGDIDVQSLAGATSTATHGTGKTLKCLAGEIQGLTLLTANGTLMRIDGEHNASLLPAAQVALGALGIVTEIDMQLVDTHKLHRRVQFRNMDTLMGEAMDLWDAHRNFEFFYIPFSGTAMSITHDVTQAADTPRDEDESDDAIMQLKALRDRLGWFPWLRKKLLGSAIANAPEENVIGDSWQLLSSARNVHFNEMEYHLPIEAGLAALDEVRHYIERHRSDVFFPLECRMTAGDKAWLSPFNDGPRISVAVHTHAPDDYAFLFTHIEPILRRHGGRPHWGKLNSLDGRALATLYPQFEAFADLRRELDPGGKFANAYLADLFGAVQ